jgi:hypothetical protein
MAKKPKKKTYPSKGGRAPGEIGGTSGKSDQDRINADKRSEQSRAAPRGKS